MLCTSKEQETCRVEKRGCKGCFYENETSEKKIVKDREGGEEHGKNRFSNFKCY